MKPPAPVTQILSFFSGQYLQTAQPALHRAVRDTKIASDPLGSNKTIWTHQLDKDRGESSAMGTHGSKGYLASLEDW